MRTHPTQATRPGRAANGGRLASIDGVDLHLHDDGPPGGRPVLMLHGFMLSSAWFDGVVPHLAGCRIIRVDLLGHGGSAAPSQGYGPPRTGQLIAQLLEQLDVRDVAVVGHSMGAVHGVAVAEATDRVTAVVILGEGPDMSTAKSRSGEWLLHLPVIGPLAHDHAPTAALRIGLKLAFAPGFPIDHQVRHQFVRDYRSLTHTAFSQSLKERADYVTTAGLDDRLRVLDLPTLVIFGEQDQMHHVAPSIARYQTIPNVHVERLDGVGHCSMAEAPERTARLLDGFLRP